MKKKVDCRGCHYWVDEKGNAYTSPFKAALGIASPSLTMMERMNRFTPPPPPAKTEPDKASEKSTVNHPAHYTAGKVECIDALEAATTELSGIEAVCTANAIKYLWRWKVKNGVEDLRKAIWYIERLISKLEE